MNLWDEILARIETKVNRHSFYTWFRPTSFVSDSRSAVTVRVPNTLFKDWLTKHYAGVIAEAMVELKRPNLLVNFVSELKGSRFVNYESTLLVKLHGFGIALPNLQPDDFVVFLACHRFTFIK